MKYTLKKNTINTPERDLLDDLRRTARKLGTSYISNKDYAIHGRYNPSTYVRRFGGWNAALIKAGLRIKRLRHIPAQSLMDNLKRVWDTLGRQPLYNEMVKPLSAFYVTVYVHRYGTWNKALDEFIKWSRKQKLACSRQVKKQKNKNTPSSRAVACLPQAGGMEAKTNANNAALTFVSPDGRKQKQKLNAQQKNKKNKNCTSSRACRGMGSLHDYSHIALTEAEQRLKKWNHQWVGKGNGKRNKNKNGYKTITKGMRYDILKRDNFKCVLCGRSPANDPKIILHIDHIIPKSRGGDNKPVNLQTLCSDCNWGKSTK